LNAKSRRLCRAGWLLTFLSCWRGPEASGGRRFNRNREMNLQGLKLRYSPVVPTSASEGKPTSASIAASRTKMTHCRNPRGLRRATPSCPLS
jgi:hypothetical protein